MIPASKNSVDNFLDKNKISIFGVFSALSKLTLTTIVVVIMTLIFLKNSSKIQYYMCCFHARFKVQ